jgi:hypothetical protein
MTHEEVAGAKALFFLTAAGLTPQDVTVLRRYVADDVAVCDFQLPDNPCRWPLFKASKAAGVIEFKKLGVTFREITEESHCLKSCPDMLHAVGLTTPSIRNAVSLQSIPQANTALLPATLELMFGIDAMGVNQ